MSLPPRLVTFLGVAAALFALGSGVALGTRLAERASQPGHDQLLIVDPALATAGAAQSLRSPGGFTGFDGAGSLPGAAVRTGTVGVSRDGAFEVASQGSSLGIRTTSTARLFRLRRAATGLRAGDAVIVRVQPDGAAGGVLRVPRDLTEGTGRPSPTGTATAPPASTPAR